MYTSRSYRSSGQLKNALRCSIRSCTSIVNPLCIVLSMISPAVLNGSAKILYSGRFHAPGEVLSAANTMNGSDGRSKISISATPGPAPRTLPENASASRSCPAPYRCKPFATSVSSTNVSHAK